MGKKIRKEMEQQRERFVSGAIQQGIQPGQAETIFELLAKFADYGFNKSHAAAYALVSYHTAYMKTHIPGRVPRSLNDAGHEQHRQAVGVSH